MVEIKVLEGEEFISIYLGDKELSVIDYNDDYVLAECNVSDLADLEISDYPINLTIKIHDPSGFGTYLFHEMEISKFDNTLLMEFICHTPNKYWEGRWGLATYLDAIRKQVGFFDGIELGEIELEDDWKKLSLIFKYNLPYCFTTSINEACEKIRQVLRTAEIILHGFIWKNEYEQDEMLFCNEVLTPLLRRMKFLSVSFNHGTKEFGKDYTFSELTPFGDLRHYGLQAKAGNISGGVNSQIDEIIGQIGDAFNMPYYEIGSKDERYISVFIVAISGHYTNNAKDKIVQKINKGLIGSVYFFDKDKILELVENYWNK